MSIKDNQKMRKIIVKCFNDCQTKTQQLEDTMTLADRETPVDGIKCDQKWFEQYNSQEVFNGLKK